MIDEGWQQDYGVFEFNKTKIPDPARLIYDLHQMGFAVMLWVTPNVACAGPHYYPLRDKGYLLRDKDGKIAIPGMVDGLHRSAGSDASRGFPLVSRRAAPPDGMLWRGRLQV